MTSILIYLPECIACKKLIENEKVKKYLEESGTILLSFDEEDAREILNDVLDGNVERNVYLLREEDDELVVHVGADVFINIGVAIGEEDWISELLDEFTYSRS